MKKILLIATIALSLKAAAQTSYYDRQAFANNDSTQHRVSWATRLYAASYTNDTTALGWTADWVKTEPYNSAWLLPMTTYVIQQIGGSASVSDAAILTSVTNYYATFAAIMKRRYYVAR